jgi:hypothetical protein
LPYFVLLSGEQQAAHGQISFSLFSINIISQNFNFVKSFYVRKSYKFLQLRAGFFVQNAEWIRSRSCYQNFPAAQLQLMYIQAQLQLIYIQTQLLQLQDWAQRASVHARPRAKVYIKNLT